MRHYLHMQLVGHLLQMASQQRRRLSSQGLPPLHTVTSPAAACLHAGVVGFLAVCCVAGVLLWKHRHWWANGNGGAKDSDEDEPDKDP
jgi:hypothetical protein